MSGVKTEGDVPVPDDGFDPRGYPCCVIKDFDNRQQQYPAATAMKKNTQGKIVELSTTGWAKVSGSHHETGGVYGWIPLAYLQIGRVRKFGNIKVHLETEVLPAAHNTNTDIIWTRTVTEPFVETYRRPAVKVLGQNRNTASARKLYFSITSSTPSSARISSVDFVTSFNVGPPAGSLVHPFVEMTLDGKGHPHSFAARNAIAIWHHGHVGERIAVGVEWFEPGNRGMRKLYFRERNDRLMNKSVPASFRGIAHSHALIAYFYQVPQQPFSWQSDFGIANVRPVEFDYLEQTVTIKKRRQGTPGERLLAPSRLPDSAIVAQMMALGVTNVGHVWQEFPRDSLQGQEGRVTCDACFVDHREGKKASGEHYQLPCYRNSPKDPCRPCWDKGLLCSWTSTALLDANDGAIYKNVKERLLQPMHWAENRTEPIRVFDAERRTVQTLSYGELRQMALASTPS